jgi:peptidoglycan hydrolase-like protein with peptidoglycan-binding domain
MKNFAKKLFLSILTLTLLFIFSGQAWAVTFRTNELISKHTDGTLANEASGGEYVTVSSDGRYIVFKSYASNLVASDTNGVDDVFLRDTDLNTTERISVSNSGTEGVSCGGSINGSSILVNSISDDNRYIVFSSDCGDLVSGDTNNVADVFVRDTQLDTTTRVSIRNNGTQADEESVPGSISSDGRYVLFSSLDVLTVAGDNNFTSDIFIRDTQLNTTTRASVSTAGVEGDGSSREAFISSDNRYVFFNSDATNLVADDTNGETDIFVRDTQLNTTTRASVSTAGVEGDGFSFMLDISSDGRYVLFNSDATNLVADDTNGETDIFVRDTQLNTTTRISVSTAGVEGDEASGEGTISADGDYIVFYSDATNLVSGDTNAVEDVFVRDTQLNTTTRISVSTAGVQGNGSSTYGSISADGETIVFLSSATNLVSGDTNGFGDLFLSRMLSTPTTTTQSASSITTTTATLNGNITDTGGEANTERGFDIGTDNTYTMSDVADPTGSYSTGAYTGSATGLSCGTTYHYRAYSTNTAGTGTGSDQEFTTSACPSSSSSSGSSASSRAQNLINMGKVQEAQTIINQFPTQTQNVNLNTNNTNPTTPKPTNTPTVRKGNRNNTVKYIQEYLKIKADGIFGPITQSAVIEFQKQHNLVPDGVVGPRTWGVIQIQ